MLEKIKLIEGYAKESWRYWSNQVLALMVAAATYAALHPEEAADLIAYVPETWRPLATVGVGLTVWWLRGARQ